MADPMALPPTPPVPPAAMPETRSTPPPPAIKLPHAAVDQVVLSDDAGKTGWVPLVKLYPPPPPESSAVESKPNMPEVPSRVPFMTVDLGKATFQTGLHITGDAISGATKGLLDPKGAYSSAFSGFVEGCRLETGVFIPVTKGEAVVLKASVAPTAQAVSPSLILELPF